MKLKSKKLSSLFIALLFAVSSLVFTTCDMVYISDPNNVSADSSDNGGDSSDNGGDSGNTAGGSRFISETERDELEKNGHFLKLLNMPLNTQTPNVYSVSVANSANIVGKFDKNKSVLIYKEANTCTVYLTLVYNDDSDFLETGFFYTAFTVHVDALTKYIVDISDSFIVSYTDGRGTVDVNNLPSVSIDSPRYLTIYNLPANVSVNNFSNVLVHNQTGSIATCLDYSQIVLSVNDNKASAKIPLHYKQLKTPFSESGVFFVSFDINIDAEIRYILPRSENVKIPFTNGNAFLDILNIPETPVPYLTISGIPLNALKQQVSNVNVYNAVGEVAKCSDNKDIVVVKGNEYLTFLIPLTSSDGGYFSAFGRFAVSFTIQIDVDTQIIFSRKDDLVLEFNYGSAEIDLISFFGYFDASLANMNDSSRPVIKAGSTFDVNGKLHTVKSNLTVDAITPNSSCVMYLYSYVADLEFYFEFSATAPTYNPNRRGWYNGNKRALWKMVYLHNAGLFLFKTYIEDNFPQFNTSGFSYNNDYSQLIASKPVYKSINGSINPVADTITLDPGVYVVELKGAGGGKGYNYETSVSGGTGGLIREIITLNSKTSITAFTGSSGEHAPQPSSNGKFFISSTKNYASYTTYYVDTSTDYTYYYFNPPSFIESNDPLTLYGTTNIGSGGGGGGGGSGTFLYSSDYNYLLVAGGGGGSSGCSFYTPGGGGGAGGVTGPGAGGGASGWLNLDSTNYANSGKGGVGGGFGAGIAGQSAGNGGNASSLLTSNSLIYGGTNNTSYSFSNFSSLSFFSITLSISYGELNHNNISSSDFPIVYIKSNFTVSENGSGRGGDTTSASYPPGYMAWLNTANVGGNGGSSLPLLSPSLPDNNSFYWGFIPEFPGQYNSVNYFWYFIPNSHISESCITVNKNYGTKGADGGNNRNDSRGGGAASGEAGNITIYKIY